MRIQSISFSVFKNVMFYKNTNFSKNLLLQSPDTFTFTGGKKGAKHYTSDEIREQNEKIKTALLEAINKGETLTGKMLAEKTGVALHVINKRFLKEEDLYAFWQKVKSFDNFRYSEEERSLFTKKTGEILENAQRTNTKVTMRELEKKLGVSKSVFLEIIENNEYYKELYAKVQKGKPFKIRTKEEISAEEEKIKNLLLDLIKNKQKKTDKEYAQRLGMTQSLFKKRIDSNPELRILYEQIQNPPRRSFEGGFETKKEEIRLLLQKYANRGIKIKAKDFIKKADISFETFRRMCLTDKEINSLWTQVKTETHESYSRQDIETIDNFIHRFLLLKAEKGEKTTIAEIADYYKLSPEFVYKRLRLNPSLSYRWDKVKSRNIPYYDKDDKDLQTEQIIEILKEAVELNIKVTTEELSMMTKLSQAVVRRRINSSPRATRWWEKNKNIGK